VSVLTLVVHVVLSVAQLAWRSAVHVLVNALAGARGPPGLDLLGDQLELSLNIQESRAIAKMTARCADKSKQTATPPPEIT